MMDMKNDDLALLPEMIQAYLEHRNADIEKCKAALQAAAFTVFEKIGHQLKGNGASFGFPEIGDMGTALEKAGKTKNAAEAASLVSSLEDFVQLKLQSIH